MNADNCILAIRPSCSVSVWLLLLSLPFTGCGDSGPQATKPDTTVRVTVANDLISLKGGVPGEQIEGSIPLPARLEEIAAVLGEPDRSVDTPESEVLIWDKHGLVAYRQDEDAPIHNVTFCYHEVVLDHDPRHKFSGEITISDHTITPVVSVSELKSYGYSRPTMLPIYEYKQRVGNLGVTLITGEFDRGEFVKQIVIFVPKENRKPGTANSSNNSTNNSAGNGTTYGSCIVTGNMNSFQVKSDKDITRIQVGSVSGGTGVNINMAGARTTINKVDDRTLSGSASGQLQLKFTIHHTDGSTSEVTVHR